MTSLSERQLVYKVFSGRCSGCGRFQLRLIRARPAGESRLPIGLYCGDCRDWMMRRYESDLGEPGWVAAS